MPRLRVLMLTAYPAIGGPLPKLAPLVADGLRQCGCDVALAAWSAHRAGREGLGAKVIGRTADLVRVHLRIRRWRPDVVYVATAHNWPGLLRDLPLVLTFRRGRPPIVLHFHGSQCDRLGSPGQRLLTALSGLLVRRAASVMLLSSDEMHVWQRRCANVEFDVVVNPYVAPPQGELASKASGAAAGGSVPTLLTVARLIPEKGVFDLVDAFALVRRSRECRLLVAGVGPAREELGRRISALGLDCSVELLGYVDGDQLADAYRGADLFVLPTYFAEGFPLSIMEAMGYGLPIVTTPIRGSADQLVDGDNGLFVPARDPHALAQAIERLLNDEALRSRMAARNAARAADFAPCRVIPLYARILERAAVDGRRAVPDGRASGTRP